MNWSLTDRDYLPGYRALLGVVLFETAVVLVVLAAAPAPTVMVKAEPPGVTFNGVSVEPPPPDDSDAYELR